MAILMIIFKSISPFVDIWILISQLLFYLLLYILKEAIVDEERR